MNWVCKFYFPFSPSSQYTMNQSHCLKIQYQHQNMLTRLMFLQSQSLQVLLSFHYCWEKCSAKKMACHAENIMNTSPFVMNKNELQKITCDFTSLCRIFLSCMCFNPKDICTNQSRIYVQKDKICNSFL